MTLIDADDVIEAWLDARKRGHLTYSAAAAQLGMRTNDLRRIITHARDQGDPRIPSLRDTMPTSYDQMARTPILDQHIPYQQGERQAAVRYIAGIATDVADFRNLVDALGLAPIEGRP